MIDPDNRRPGLKPQSLMVHAGTTRSQAEETAEGIFMTSGYVYKTAEEAENAFVVEGALPSVVAGLVGVPVIAVSARTGHGMEALASLPCGAGSLCTSRAWSMAESACTSCFRASAANGFSRAMAAKRCPASERTVSMARAMAWKLGGAKGTSIPAPASIIPLATKKVSACVCAITRSCPSGVCSTTQ